MSRRSTGGSVQCLPSPMGSDRKNKIEGEIGRNELPP